MKDATSQDDRGQELHDDEDEDEVESPSHPRSGRYRRCAEPQVRGNDEHADGDQSDRPAPGSAPPCPGRVLRMASGRGCRWRGRGGLPAHGQVVASADLMEPGAEQHLQPLQVGVVMGLGVQEQGVVLCGQCASPPAEVDRSSGVGPGHLEMCSRRHVLQVASSEMRGAIGVSAEVLDVLAELSEVAAGSSCRDCGVRSGHRDLRWW